MNLYLGLVLYGNHEAQLEHYLFSLQKSLNVVDPTKNLSAKLLILNGSGKPIEFPTGKSLEIIDIPITEPLNQTAALNALTKTFLEMSTDKGDLFFISHPSSYFHPFFFSELLLLQIRHPKDLIEAALFPNEHPKSYDLGTLETKWACGFSCMYSNELFNEIGLFDENLPDFGANIDFSWRVRASGRKIRFNPAAKYARAPIEEPSSDLEKVQMYEAGLYLGYKWNNSQFFSYCKENLLKELKQSELKTFDSPKMTTEISESFAQDFSYHFQFSEVRWSK